MAFVAKGKIYDIKMSSFGFGKKIASIVAEMHEGWLGKGHLVNIKVDPKFAEEIAKKLGHEKKTWDVGRDYPERVTFHEFNGKRIIDHNIEIIIK